MFSWTDSTGPLSALALVFAIVAGSASATDAMRDEASRQCPADLNVADRIKAWWCGFDPETVVDNPANPKRLNAFQEHSYTNVSSAPNDDSRDLDWTCIDGECGGLLDKSFIHNRELTHLWKPEAGSPPLVMTEEQRRRAIRGRNSWLLWSGGNHGFWDYLARYGPGLSDFLKILDNRYISRSDRFRKLGVINEPGMVAPGEAGKFGLQLDVPDGWTGEWPPPPGVALPKEVPDPYVYGYSSGVMGFRLFPNPDFYYGDQAAEAQANWDPDRYLNDDNYSKNSKLIRPYRVGMSCGFCHVSYLSLIHI